MPTLPARTGTHALISAGQTLKITQSHGPQVVDTWAFSLPISSSSSSSSKSTPPTYLSMTHTRSTLCKISLSPGDTLRSNTRQPMLTLLEDTSPGVHDMLFAACDRYRYQQLGVDGYHDSCADNLHRELTKIKGLKGLMLIPESAPDPLNLFMNVPVTELGGGEGGGMGIEKPRSKQGDFVVVRAEVDLVVVMSACPMDMNDVNGRVVKDVDFEVI